MVIFNEKNHAEATVKALVYALFQTFFLRSKLETIFNNFLDLHYNTTYVHHHQVYMQVINARVFISSFQFSSKFPKRSPLVGRIHPTHAHLIYLSHLQNIPTYLPPCQNLANLCKKNQFQLGLMGIWIIHKSFFWYTNTRYTFCSISPNALKIRNAFRWESGVRLLRKNFLFVNLRENVTTACRWNCLYIQIH